jgi:sodium-dependent dicarboxylate transporter 2/3/5
MTDRTQDASGAPVTLQPSRLPIDRRKTLILLFGLAVFLAVYFSPPWAVAIDPSGKQFVLSHEGKAAIGLFLMAGIWWVFEVIPIGVTAIAIGVFQAMFFIRPAKEAFHDFMDPSVMFIFGSIVIGLAFTRTGLTKRIAYRMLAVAGERTDRILLGALVVTAGLAHLMAHTAVAATMFPILLAIYALYGEGERPTNFGKALFIGMAYAAGAGSIVTFLGAARAPAAAAMYEGFTGHHITFFQLTEYMFVIGWGMVFLIWLYLKTFLKPEKAVIPGLKDTVRRLSAAMGPMSRQEKLVLAIVAALVLVMSTKSFIPLLAPIDRSAIILTTTLLFFILGVLTVKDLEEVPWNIILLFSGAMSIGFCLWNTGAAEWMAVQWLGLFREAHWWVFVMGIAAFVLIMTNFIMNVAAIAIVLPVALVIARYLGVAPEVIVYSALVTAGMPFLLLIGAAPNAIAYDSKQFTTGEFFRHGIPMSLLLLVLLGLALVTLWPMLGMPILADQP